LKRETLAAINEARRAGRALVRATDLETGDDQLIDRPQTLTACLAAAGAARADTSGPAHIEGRSWFSLCSIRRWIWSSSAPCMSRSL